MVDVNLTDMNDVQYFKDTDGSYLSVYYDPAPENPFGVYDSLGTFFTWQSNHISPHDHDFVSPQHFVESVLSADKAFACESMQDVLQALDGEGYAARGIYRFEHGSVSYALGEANPYGDPWDSGAVGFAFVSPEKLEAEGMTKEQAIACMEAEMQEYSAWANGDVFLAERYDEQGVPMEVATLYGLDDFEAEYPNVEPIDLGDFPDLQPYAEFNNLTQELEGEWSYRFDAGWRHDAYIKEPMAIVSDEQGASWRVVNMDAAQVSFDAYDTPQEALSAIKQQEGVSKEELNSFIPPREILNKPLDHLVQEAKERAAEKSALHISPDKDRKPPELGL